MQVRQLAEYTITLTELEDNLLFRLANSQGDILEDIELIENLEETKRTAVEIEEKVSGTQRSFTSLSINIVESVMEQPMAAVSVHCTGICFAF